MGDYGIASLIVVASFTKVRLLGRGDVGKVYLVKQKGTDKLLAMKGKQIACVTHHHHYSLLPHLAHSQPPKFTFIFLSLALSFSSLSPEISYSVIFLRLF